MEPKQKSRYLFLGLVAALVLASVGIIRSISLQNELQRTQEELNQQENALETANRIRNIDSLLASGYYHQAEEAYKAELTDTEQTDSIGIALRISLARRMLRLQEEVANLRTGRDSILTADSLNRDSISAGGNIRLSDSLNFVLEKARVQLAGLRRQLREQSTGEYLTFESEKGNQMHYVGQVSNGMANGYGVAILDTGSRYEGEWRDNRRHGQGSFYWQDGEYYVGEYRNGLRSGAGTYYWPNGEKFTGQWANDRRNGEGTFYGSDGEVLASGTWEKDKLVEERK